MRAPGTRTVLALVLVTPLATGCGGTSAATGGALPASGSVWVLFQLADRSVHLGQARPGGATVNLSARLGVSGTATMSLNGRYVAVTAADGCAALSTGHFTKSRVAFDCSDGEESDEGTSVCELGTGAGAVRVVLREPTGTWTAFHSPGYRPDGGLVFECHQPGEELVCALPAGSTTPTRLTAPDLSNDNSPCVFPDGRVASLVDTGIHTVRLADPDGTGSVSSTTGTTCWTRASTAAAEGSPSRPGPADLP